MLVKNYYEDAIIVWIITFCIAPSINMQLLQYKSSVVAEIMDLDLLLCHIRLPDKTASSQLATNLFNRSREMNKTAILYAFLTFMKL